MNSKSKLKAALHVSSHVYSTLSQSVCGKSLLTYSETITYLSLSSEKGILEGK